MQTTPTLLSVKGLKKHFSMPKRSLFYPRQKFKAVDGVDLEIFQGETFGLVGESGCGKSTFGRTILQLQKPTEGEVCYFGGGGEVRLPTLPHKEMRKLRKDLQIVFQDPYSSLNPRMTVGQILEEGIAVHGLERKGSPQMKEYLAQVMEECGLQPYMLHRYPHQFSGGQRQRVCIARALALRPKFVVCDECVSALDVSVQSQILNLLTDLKEKEGLTYLFISHDLAVVRHISNRIGVMYLGRFVELGESERVFTSPAHPYTATLISAIPEFGGKKKEKILLEGNMPSAVSPPTGCPFHTRCYMAREVCKREVPQFREIEKGRFVSCHFALPLKP